MKKYAIQSLVASAILAFLAFSGPVALAADANNQASASAAQPLDASADQNQADTSDQATSDTDADND